MTGGCEEGAVLSLKTTLPLRAGVWLFLFLITNACQSVTHSLLPSALSIVVFSRSHSFGNKPYRSFLKSQASPPAVSPTPRHSFLPSPLPQIACVVCV